MYPTGGSSWASGVSFLFLAGLTYTSFPSPVSSFQTRPTKSGIGRQHNIFNKMGLPFKAQPEAKTNALASSHRSKKAEMENCATSTPITLWEQAFTIVGSSTSKVVAGTFYLVLVYQRDAFMVSFFIGSISNGILSKVLKKVLKQERPTSDEALSKMKLPPSDNGMPSSHAMSLGFIGIVTALQLPWTAPPLILYVIISLAYRVRANLHTIEQVAVGVILGSINGCVWRSLCLGSNPFGVNIMNWVSENFLNSEGLLPWYGLAVPAVVGAAVVGSIERRISKFLASSSSAKKKE